MKFKINFRTERPEGALTMDDPLPGIVYHVHNMADIYNHQRWRIGSEKTFSFVELLIDDGKPLDSWNENFRNFIHAFPTLEVYGSKERRQRLRKWDEREVTVITSARSLRDCHVIPQSYNAHYLFGDPDSAILYMNAILTQETAPRYAFDDLIRVTGELLHQTEEAKSLYPGRTYLDDEGNFRFFLNGSR